MDEPDIKHVLNKHVTRREPPFGITAQALVATGRRRARWRTGITYGAGSVAVVVTVTGALTVLGNGGQSALDNPCRLPIAAGWRPVPSADPSGPWPSGMPSGEPSVEPSNPPVEPTTTSYPYQTARPMPSGTPWEPLPTASADPPRIEAANCYLAQELRAMFPDARFAGAYEHPPMVLHGGRSVYVALGTIVSRDASTYLILNITNGSPPSESHDWKVRKEDGKLIRSRDDGLIQVEVHTGHTLVYLSASGPMLTVDQVERLAGAPALDLFRP